MNYDHLTYGRDELASVMRRTYDELIDFVTTPQFLAVMNEFGTLESRRLPAFVLTVLLNPDELARRGVVVPPGVLIQRSSFGDRRPTLFCVKKFLPQKYMDVWQNVNITIDEEFLDSAVSREPSQCWRNPLPVHVQSQLMADGVDLQKV